MSTTTRSATSTYTTVDVENVIRRMKADFAMIAESTGAWSADEAANYAHDIEVLAKKGYLAWVDLTLFGGLTEVKAVRYVVDENSGGLTSDRPGGVRWPRVLSPRLRIVVSHTHAYDDAARRTTSGSLKMSWTTSNDDTSHASLNGGDGRNYVSSAYGLKRKDWEQ